MQPLLKLCAPSLRLGAILAFVALGACTGDSAPTSPARAEPEPRRLLIPTVFTQVEAGGAHTCALRSDGSAFCVGSNYDGEAVAPAGQFTAISAGYRHSCALDLGGSAVCWGDGFVADSPSPAGPFVSLSSGYRHTCALRGDGSATCWGLNDDGQSSPPTGPFVSVSAGRFHSCALRSDGTAACWGDDSFGQSTPPSGTFTAVIAGDFHGCGRRIDGTAECWGLDDDGQSSPPTGQFTALSAGKEFTCGLRNDGTVSCWGKNDLGQSAPPTGSFVEVSAGSFHACARRSDGTAVCWGDDTDGRATPVLRVLPTATFTAPASVIVGQSIPLALTNAQVPGYPAVTNFTYAFDCGAGYGTPSVSSAKHCATTSNGSVTVRGKVIDPDGDAREYSSSVTVLSVPEATTALRVAVEASTLSPDIRKALFAKLDAALRALEKGQTATACSALKDLMNQLQAQRGKAIPTATADAWLLTAQALRAGLGC